MHENGTVADGGVNGEAACGIDCVGGGVECRGIGRVSADQNDVCKVSGGDDACIEAEGFCSVAGGDGEGFVCGEDGGVVPEELLEEGCGLHLGEHVEVVVGGCSVGSEGDVDACGLHFWVGECPAYGEFHVADWVVDGGYAAFGEEGDVIFVEPAAVGCDAAFGEDAAVVEPGDDPHAVGFDAVGVFVGFVDVDVEGDVFFLRELGTPAESFFGDGVDGVGGDAGHDAWVVHGPDVCDGFFHDAAFGFEFVMVAAVDHAVGEAGPDAGFVDGFCDVFHHEVHVVEGGGAGADHFEAGEFCAPVDVGFGEVGFSWPDFGGEPFEEGHVVGVAAEESHGGVGVHVDHAGECCGAGSVDDELGVMVGDFFGDFADEAGPVEVDFGGFVVDGYVSDEDWDGFSEDVCFCHASVSTILVRSLLMRSPFCLATAMISL